MTDVAVDACCLINLLAAGSILPDPSAPKVKGKASTHALNRTLHIPNAVAAESLYLLQPDDGDESLLVKAPIDVQSYFDAGVLIACTVEGDEETDLFVQFATRLDDGEAACLAIARNRNWAIATDDRPARKLANQFDVPVVTTVELVKEWANSSNARKPDIRDTLQNIQRFARFMPRQNSPEAEWWFSHVGED